MARSLICWFIHIVSLAVRRLRPRHRCAQPPPPAAGLVFLAKFVCEQLLLLNSHLRSGRPAEPQQQQIKAPPPAASDDADEDDNDFDEDDDDDGLFPDSSAATRALVCVCV